MQFRRSSSIYLSFVAVTLLILASLLKPSTLNSTMSCQSRHTLIKDDLRLDANYGFVLGDNNGELNIHGIVVEGDAYYQIRRLIMFSYTKSHGVYILRSQNIENLSNDTSADSNVNTLLPSFFYEAGKSIAFRVEDDKYGNPVVYMHNMPYFFCKAYIKP